MYVRAKHLKRGVSETLPFRFRVTYYETSRTIVYRRKYPYNWIYDSCTFNFYHTVQAPPDLDDSLHLLLARREGYRLAPQPQSNKGEPSDNSYSDTCNPRPGAADGPTPWPLIMCKVADGDSVLLLDIGEEGPLVVDLKVEYAVLVW